MSGIVACWQDHTLPLLALQNVQLRSERVCLRELRIKSDFVRGAQLGNIILAYDLLILFKRAP